MLSRNCAFLQIKNNAARMSTQDFIHLAEDIHPAGSDPNWQYLSDELRRLDLLLRLQLDEKSFNADDPLQFLKGLVITADEIAPLLSSTIGGTSRPRAESAAGESLARALEEISARIDGQIREDSESGRYRLELPRFLKQFRLNPIEKCCLLVCLAPELNHKYERLFAYIQDDVTRKRPTVGLVLQLACDSPAEQVSARGIFDVDAPLRKYRLVHMAESAADGPYSLLSRSLKLDDRIANQLLGRRALEATIARVAQILDPAHEAGLGVSREIAERMSRFVDGYFATGRSDNLNVLFHLRGLRDGAQLSMAAVAANHLGLPLLRCDARCITSSDPRSEETLWLLAREAALQPAVLAIENFDAWTVDGEHGGHIDVLLEAVSALSRLTFLFGRRAWRPTLRFRERMTLIQHEEHVPGYVERIAIWRQQLAQETGGEEIDAAALASRFRFTAGQVRDSLASVHDQFHWQANGKGRLDQRDIYRACRAQSNPALEVLAHKVEPIYGWDDLVLPDDQLEQLRELCNQARFRHLVLGEWGFDRKHSHGKGIATLFSGPPGTGKTMAAEVVAGELALDLYKIDLSQVVSKYIGESEKNLDRVFAAAEDSNAILFFDEADALFGKRSEVRDSHDRYANLEISYLLQKMEEYEGVSILATNMRSHLDDAFLRRLQGVVEFPFPDAAQRERIWRVMFPDDAPLAADVDLSRLASEIRLTGANIKNISLAAAYLAADNGGAIGMSHLYRAARREHEKIGRAFDAQHLAVGGAR